jgi:hypothetical protein
MTPKVKRRGEEDGRVDGASLDAAAVARNR